MSSAPPSRDVYLAPGFQASTLKVAQLRSILLEHNIHYLSNAKKADLVNLFNTQLVPRAGGILAADSRVRPSAHGIVAVSSQTGDETPIVQAAPVAGAKRGRKPKKVSEPAPEAVAPDAEAEPETEPAPPAKRPRGRPRKTVEPAPAPVAVEPPVPQIPSEFLAPAPPSAPASTRKRVLKNEPIVDIPISPARQQRAYSGVTPSSPAPPSSSSRRKSERPSVSTASDSLALPVPDIPAHLASPSKRKAKVEPEVQGDAVAPTPRKVGRPRKSVKAADIKEERSEPEEAPVQNRRISAGRRSDADNEDSGFSDFNPFQSGSGEAAERERRRRKSSLGLGETKRRAPRPSEWTATSAPTSILRKVGPGAGDQRVKSHIEIAEDHNRVVQQKLTEITSAAVDEEPSVEVSQAVVRTPRKAIIRRKPSTAPTPSTIGFVLLAILGLGLSTNYKITSSSNGYCDVGSKTNSFVEQREAAIAATQACHSRRAQWQVDNPGQTPPFVCDATALPILPFLPRPTACTACPAHATCEKGEVKECAPEYILTPSILSPLAPLFDGWPGLQSRVFPPRCRPDTARMRQIGALVREVNGELSRHRGDVICKGLPDQGNKGAGEIYGVAEETLRESFASRRIPTVSREAFDELFDAALKDLVSHDDVIESIDSDGSSWYAASHAEFTLACRAKLEARSLLDRWKSQLISTLFVLLGIAYVARSIETRREETERVRELVGTVLQRLQDQEYQHYVDPVVTPQPYLPSQQLRDVVLPASVGSATRQRLWDRVTDNVEKNANIQVREREVNGDVWKTWEWTGVASKQIDGAASPSRAIAF
ncbi:inner nuclear membrane protein enriched at telomere/subtelomere region [Vanrija albida]|uniref:Inner nuclear membrane protein enriched at telomere/subtelomere region n=1 Tax=Vanrija albida TaxID=181172 RepID=A0ABR3QBX0_9TREE